jgi:hypothetical protein
VVLDHNHFPDRGNRINYVIPASPGAVPGAHHTWSIHDSVQLVGMPGSDRPGAGTEINGGIAGASQTVLHHLRKKTYVNCSTMKVLE